MPSCNSQNCILINVDRKETENCAFMVAQNTFSIMKKRAATLRPPKC